MDGLDYLKYNYLEGYIDAAVRYIREYEGYVSDDLDFEIKYYRKDNGILVSFECIVGYEPDYTSTAFETIETNGEPIIDSSDFLVTSKTSKEEIHKKIIICLEYIDKQLKEANKLIFK